MGKIRPRADQHGVVPQNVVRHHLGKDLSNGLSDYQILGCSGHLPRSLIHPSGDVAADSGPHGLSGINGFKMQSSDVASSVATEAALVSGHR